MTEAPKPITRLAEPIDRSGPRRPNLHGALTLRSAIGAWVTSVPLIVRALMPVPPWFAILLLIGLPIAVGLTFAVLIRGIVAMMRAADEHRKRWPALAGFGLIAALAACWVWVLRVLWLR